VCFQCPARSRNDPKRLPTLFTSAARLRRFAAGVVEFPENIGVTAALAGSNQFGMSVTRTNGKKYHDGNLSAKSRSTDRARPFDRAHPVRFYRRSGICSTFAQRRAVYAPATAVYAPATAVYAPERWWHTGSAGPTPRAWEQPGVLRDPGWQSDLSDGLPHLDRWHVVCERWNILVHRDGRLYVKLQRTLRPAQRYRAKPRYRMRSMARSAAMVAWASTCGLPLLPMMAPFVPLRSRAPITLGSGSLAVLSLHKGQYRERLEPGQRRATAFPTDSLARASPGAAPSAR